MRYWRNEAGNAFGPTLELAPFPECDALSSVELIDLLGTGTACLVWTSPSTRDDRDRVRYLDLARGADPSLPPDDPALAGVKPHLLCGITNNLGAQTLVRYAASTRHYLDAAEAGEPWLTRLPFPVQVVDSTVMTDQISGTRLVTRHRYRHGHFDGAEREFRGFGLVETVDAETVPGPPGPPLSDDLTLPPVRTRSWFDLGLYPPVGLTAGHWSGDGLAVPLPPSEVDGATSGEEQRQGHRALAGSSLRTEVYADDGTPEAAHPYQVTEQRHRAVRLQPARDGAPAVFHAHALESVSWHYERDPADPRVTHQLVLEVDGFGAVRQTASVGYRRRQPAVPEQATTWVTWTVTEVAHTSTPVVHRLATPVRLSTFEVTGLPDPGSGRYPYGLVRDALAAAPPEIPYEATPVSGGVQVRLIDRSRTAYWSDDLGGELPAGQVGIRALARTTYRLALTPGLVASVFGDRVTPELLAGEGGYAQADGGWWIPSGIQIYDPAGFFLPAAMTDPFGTTASVEYDPYHLLPVRMRAAQTEPYATESIVDNDYRLLAPWRSVDVNGNRSWVTFDALGAVTAVWSAGKVGEDDGDPAGLPGAMCTYDRDAWRLHATPVWAQVETRERHGQPDSPWQRARAYSDGLGRVVMSKVQAEPGLAWTLDAVGQAVQVDTTPAVRWVGTGRTVFNNKGMPVAQYEPYFSATVSFEDDDRLVKQGVTVLMRYDPLGRVVRTDHPDGTISRTGFDPWQQAAWDRNDTVLDSAWYAERGSPDPDGEPEPADPPRRAAWLAARHAGTPTLSTLDSLGRVVRVVADDGADGQFETRAVLDVEGNATSIVDARWDHGAERC